jgi:EmrB/QacA subfamily drug resistance transporter
MAAPSHAGSWVPPDEVTFARRWWVLVVLCTSLVIVVVGNTTLNVAIPTLQRELGASQTAIQWIVDAYALVFAGLLFTAGAMGDRFGRKGALQAGLGIFALGSLGAGLIGSSEGVIAFRALMGVGAAFIMPSTLSILTNVFPPEERGKAIGIWAGLSGAGAAIGPIASGVLLSTFHFSYGAVFFVNLPIIAAALIAGHIMLPKSKDPVQGRLDPVGAVLSIIGLSSVVYAIIEGPSAGWGSSRTLGVGAAGLVVLALFAMWELRTTHPMLDLRYFKNPRFSVASGGITLVFFAMFGMFFLITQYFQLVLGYTPLGSALRQVPISLVLMAVAPNVPKLVPRYGANRVVACGLLLVGSGLLLMTTLSADSSYLHILPTMALVAAGMGATVSPMTASIMSSVPQGRAGIGSAMNDTTRELGGALGVAVLGSLLQSRYSSVVGSVAEVPPAVASTARASVSGAFRAAAKLAESGDHTGAAALIRSAREGYVSGMRLALVVGGLVVVSASMLVLRFLPGRDASMASGVPTSAAELETA